MRQENLQEYKTSGVIKCETGKIKIQQELLPKKPESESNEEEAQMLGSQEDFRLAVVAMSINSWTACSPGCSWSPTTPPQLCGSGLSGGD